MTTAGSLRIATPKLLSCYEVAHDTMAFRFERPSEWIFKAGQYLDMTLLNPPETDSEGNVRSFSIASGPGEDTLMIVTRMRDSAFKRVLRVMPLGQVVQIEGPSGDLIFQNKVDRTAVLIAGGIGITPFRSMICQAAEERLGHSIFLFYSNRRPEDAVFLEELQELERSHPKYRLIATMTQMEKSHRSWNGEIGLINQEMIRKYVTDLVPPMYYIAGPPAMVKGIHEMLNKAGVNDRDILAEEFSGY